MTGAIVIAGTGSTVTVDAPSSGTVTIQDDAGGSVVLLAQGGTVTVSASVARLAVFNEVAQGAPGADGAAGAPGPAGPQGPPGVGATDHGALTGLSDDDHAQYHTNARGDLRYVQLATYAALLAASDPFPQYLTPAEGSTLYAPQTHAHAIADVTGLQAALDAKAAVAHSHVIADVTGLQGALDGKLDDSQATAFGLSLLDDADAIAARATLGLGTAATFASTAFATDVHSHAIADVTGLQGALDGKAAVGHSHSGLAPAGGATGQVLKKNTNTDFDYSWQADNTGGGGGATITTVEVDFIAPRRERFFDVAHAGATLGQKVLAAASLDMPAGVSEDELEMDPLIVSGHCKTNGQVRLLVASANGGVIFGKRNINYQLV